MLFRLLLLYLVFLLISQVFAIETISPAMTAFAAKDYAAYLAGAQAELADAAAKPAGAFARLTVAAIALEKTAGWDGAAGTQVTDLLATSPDTLRYLLGTRQLLRGDTTGMTIFHRTGARVAHLFPRREEAITMHLVIAAEHRDADTGPHIRRIGLSAAAIARAMGFLTEEADDLRLAAPMHDIGKIGVPDYKLHKPGRFTPDEFEVMKTHTIIGASILQRTDIPMLCMARDIAIMHHERWDGRGYPTTIEGDGIPQFSRIVTVVDVLDALTSNRVYRPAYSDTEALQIMARERGRLFAPRVFDCMLDIFPEFLHIREEVQAEYALT